MIVQSRNKEDFVCYTVIMYQYLELHCLESIAYVSKIEALRTCPYMELYCNTEAVPFILSSCSIRQL